MVAKLTSVYIEGIFLFRLRARYLDWQCFKVCTLMDSPLSPNPPGRSSRFLDPSIPRRGRTFRRGQFSEKKSKITLQGD